MTKAIIGVTSYNGPFYEDGKKTGLFITEALHPFEVYRAQGIEVDFVSETGTWGPDEHSTEESFLNGDDLIVYQDKHSEFMITLSKIKKPSEVNPDDYDIFFASAGHATLFDYPTATGLISIASKIYSNGGIVAAVCHGPAIFKDFKDPTTGKLLIQGKKVTGFTDKGEELMAVSDSIKKYKLDTVEGIAAKVGAQYIAPNDPWEDFTVVDGRVATGVNPASAGSLAKKTLQIPRK